MAKITIDANVAAGYRDIDSIEEISMKTDKRILISGAGIAGPALAFWLHQYGYSVVITEKANAIRDGGQNVDIKGPAQDVIRRMALADKIESKNTLEQGQKYVDAHGRTIAVFPKGAIGSLTSNFEILRGDLATILYDTTKDRCEYRFGTFITGIEETDDCIMATFSNGEKEAFALILCAEGISSATRELVLPGQTQFRYLGVYMSFFNIPRRPEDDYWAHSINGIGGTLIFLRPGDENVTTVLATFPVPDADAGTTGPSHRKALLRRALQGRGALADRILSEIENVQDFYFGPMSQVKARSWSKGRFALVGDAAYCPTPFTGQGTALSLVGAYVLAGEIARHDSLAAAFNAYEKMVRPYIEAIQAQLSPGMIKLLHVKTAFGISCMRVLQRLFASRPMQTLMRPIAKRNEESATDAFVLPDYVCALDSSGAFAACAPPTRIAGRRG
ncbi:FAD-dependent monooxygenase [Trinickia diaoshuihuensis]|uniref:FAD-dependent monooxygenase n=1 Tax=Trinickia diaoshuihuensis TaxID=2292265 RepID=UPI001F071DEF|nr:FAD-dependent monooxygenase [Trinickia diaoshuihuensis]